MADKSDPPKLFDIFPSAEMRRALRHSMPEDTALTWHHIGDLNITGGKIAVLDVWGCHPQHLASEAKILRWPENRADIWLRLATSPEAKVVRVLTVLISIPSNVAAGGPADGKWHDGPSMAIDSASAVVGDFDRMVAECCAGGPMSQVCAYWGPQGLAQRRFPPGKSVERLVTVLAEHGFPVLITKDGRGHDRVGFARGFTEDEIAKANATLASSGLVAELAIVGSHTSAWISRALADAPFTCMNGQEGALLYAFETGFGDGIYYWDELRSAGKCVAYSCNFDPNVEVASHGPWLT